MGKVIDIKKDAAVKVMTKIAIDEGIAQLLFDNLYKCDENACLEHVNLDNSEIAPAEFLSAYVYWCYKHGRTTAQVIESVKTDIQQVIDLVADGPWK